MVLAVLRHPYYWQGIISLALFAILYLLVVYLLAGLPYKARVWESQWPVIMRNVIAACRAGGSKLVFFDNMYMYDRDHLAPMDEGTPVRPSSRKGAVRAAIAETLMSAARRGDIEALMSELYFSVAATFSGRLLDANAYATQGLEVPIVGASVSFLATGQSATSDLQGYVTVSGLPGFARRQ